MEFVDSGADSFNSETYLIEITEHCNGPVLDYLLECLRKSGLLVNVLEHCVGKTIISVRCPFDELCKQAEELCLFKSVDDVVKVRKFVYANNASYEGIEERSSFFTSAQQVLLIENVLQNVVFLTENFEKLGIKKIDSNTAFLTACMHSKPQLIENHTPMHSEDGRKKLWKSVVKSPFNFPLKDLRDYYGEDVAIYFAWMSYFTYALIPIALFGVALYLHRPKGMTVDDSPYLPVYALLMAFWAIMFIKGWKRKESELALDWGTYSIEKVTAIRPEFSGIKRISPITGKIETYYPAWKRRIRYFMSFLISLPFLMLGVGAMILSLNLNGYIKHVESPIHITFLAQFADPGGIFAADSPYYGWMVPTIGHSIVINIINLLYRKVASFSTDIENHKTETFFNNSLIVKRVLFEVFDCYLPLFYIAFYQLDIMALRRELIGLFWGDEIRRLVMESVIPFITEKIESKKLKKTAAELKKTDQHEMHYDVVENLMYEEYEQFDDYIEMVIQYGYVTLFASAFPLCSIITILFLFLEARSDMFKLLYLTRRPVVKRAKSIGVWLTVLISMTVVSMFTNCFLFGFASEQLATWVPDMYHTHTGEHTHGDLFIKDGYGRYVVGIVFCAEHVLILIVFLSHMFISDSPNFVTNEIARREYILEQEHILLMSLINQLPSESPIDLTEKKDIVGN